jgi:NAD(P)-dependent dehydrogenase (short-subunit alcohol dehydrogenase family)
MALAGADARVLVADISAEGAEETVAEIQKAGGTAVAFGCDVSDPDRVVAMIDRCELEFGGVDILVNNAGTGVAAAIVETSVADFDRIMAVNVRGVFLGIRAVIPGMLRRGGGIIVNVASAVAVRAVPDRAAYVAYKGAVLALTKAVALDHMTQGIRCNAVAPGVVDSPWFASILADAPDPAAARDAMRTRQPLGRMGQPDEIAAAVMYLCSDEARLVNGACLFVDGGFSV